MGLIKSLILLVFLIESFFLCFSLKLNETGVCSVKLSSTKTRLKSYWVTTNKMCGKKKCTAKKTKLEKYTTLTDRPVCCTGWEYKTAENICVPQCSGCLQGQCIGPDLCRCTPPLFLDPITKNCIQPECDITCINSYCNITKQCECEDQYITHNSTHCAPKCQEKYKLNEYKLTCEPICENCANGVCKKPGKCVCNEGYTFEDGKCKPVCDPECVNGECVNPNTCTCNEGFVLNKDKTCEAEDTCEEGYVKYNDVCVAKCEEFCEIDKCEENNKEANVSQVIPRVCYNSTEEDLMPICTSIGSRRRNPKLTKFIYICCPDHEYVKLTNSCKPACVYGCEGGTCIEPNKCLCDPPLILNEKGNKCIEPKCENPCINGFCINTNTCECNDQYLYVNSTHCAPECDEGFEHDQNFICQPICNPPCDNGVCINPDECECDAGFEVSDDDTACVPICQPECQNSQCIAPNTCSCHGGYELVQHDNSTCYPICDKKCNNGYCIAPNKCACDPGYIEDDTNIYNCVPACEPECVNGECKGPDFCSCFSGFESSKDKWICEPKCENCFNGTCNAPNECICDEGYKLKEGSCIPVCNKICNNGFCSGPNICTCFDGYIQGKDYSWCYKPCESGCIGGSCNQHGICSCKEGYRLENGTCILEIQFNNDSSMTQCKLCNGSCNTDESCLCADGTSCFIEPDEPAEVQSPKMAGLEVTWLVGGAIGVLLLTLLIITIERLWRKKKEQTETDKPPFGSVIYTVPDTLIRNDDNTSDNVGEHIDEEHEAKRGSNKDEIAMTSIPLLEHTNNNKLT